MQTKLPKMPVHLCSGTSAQMWAGKKVKQDESENNSCPVTERERMEHCRLKSHALTPRASDPGQSV